MVASVESGATLSVGRPRVLFDKTYLAPATGYRPYDVAPDGRFAMIIPANADSGGDEVPHLVVVQNWLEELRRPAPSP